MFYCNPCAFDREWPIAIFLSYGRCEICGRATTCNEVASSQLPMPKKREPTTPPKPEDYIMVTHSVGRDGKPEVTLTHITHYLNHGNTWQSKSAAPVRTMEIRNRGVSYLSVPLSDFTDPLKGWTDLGYIQEDGEEIV